MADPLIDLLLHPEERPPLGTFDEAWELWRRCIGMTEDRLYEDVVPAQRPDPAFKKILVIPDLHVPFHEPWMLAEMMVRAADADKVICIGDVGDAYALSRFTKYESMPYRDEWAAVNVVMQTLSECFPEVEIVLGNHDVRLERQLRDRVSEDMVEAIKFMTGGILCPISAMAKRYPNVTIAKHTTPDGHHIDWFTTCGDAWLGHPEKYSRVPGSALRSVEEWLSDNELTLGLDKFSLIVMGHTHQFSMIPWRSHQLMVEVGCLCKQAGYMMSPRIGGRPQRRGYLTFEQTNGITDLNSVRFYWFPDKREAA